ncbi:MAG: DUF6798 domain-containing protein [Pyrinomonadaceae bacterium]
MIRQKAAQRFSKFYDLHAIIILVVVVFVVAHPVPYSNEFSYLLRLKKAYFPDFLAHDITFSTPSNEYWLFDHVFGLFTFFLSFEVIGWAGRILCWVVSIYAIRKLSLRWEIPEWIVTGGIIIWILLGQSIIADEWVIGTFEAKCVAYILVFFALERICKGRDMFAAILLGLAFSFHPLIGMWALLGALVAHLVTKRSILGTAKITAIACLFSTIGLVPLLLMRIESVAPSTDSLKYFLYVRFPFHCDPFSWSRSEIAVSVLMFLFCLVVYFYSKRNVASTFLIAFLSTLFLFYISGFVLRFFELVHLMVFMPTRIYTIFVLLFFLFFLGKAIYEKHYLKPAIATLIALLAFGLFWAHLYERPVERIVLTVNSWQKPPDDMQKAFVWIRNNTPEDATIIAPPWREDFWYYANRAIPVSYDKAIDSNLNLWVSRLNEFTGAADLYGGYRNPDNLKSFYYSISTNKMHSLSKEYNARILITESVYSYKVLQKFGKVRVYEIDKTVVKTGK